VSTNWQWKASDGSTLLMVIFSVVLAVGVLLGTVSASSLYLERKRLFVIADGAALAASQSFSLDGVVVDSTTHTLRYSLTSSDVVSASRSFLRAAESRGIRLVAATSPDGVTAVVRLASTWRPPLVGVFFPAGIPIEVTAQARGTFF
jgi:uncharacterized membrane protein